MSTIVAPEFGFEDDVVSGTDLVEGTAKCKLHYDQVDVVSSSTYNISSITDTSNGNYDPNFTSNFAAVDNTASSTSGDNTTTPFWQANTTPFGTASAAVRAGFYNAGAFVTDDRNNCFIGIGDLA